MTEKVRNAFRGHGVAIRKRGDTPIPGEPFVSMDDAVQITERLLGEHRKEPPPMWATGALIVGFVVVILAVGLL